MLTQINENVWINLDDIYLVDEDPISRELLIYITYHPSYPIILKDSRSIDTFKKQIKMHYDYAISRKRLNEQQTSTTQDDKKTSKDIMEFLEREAKTRI